MGSGSSVAVRHPQAEDAHFQNLLSSREERKKLFDAISAYKVDDHITLKGRVSYKKMMGYFSNPANALYPGFDINGDIVLEAFKHALRDADKRKSEKKGKGKKKRQAAATEQLSISDFHRFLPILLLFDRLWDVFAVADKVVIEDKRVFKGEFIAIYDKLETVGDLVVLGTMSKDDWVAAFSELDKNNDGYINFSEFCTYCITTIEKPFDFPSIDQAEAESSDDEEENGAHEGGASDSAQAPPPAAGEEVAAAATVSEPVDVAPGDGTDSVV